MKIQVFSLKKLTLCSLIVAFAFVCFAYALFQTPTQYEISVSYDHITKQVRFSPKKNFELDHYTVISGDILSSDNQNTESFNGTFSLKSTGTEIITIYYMGPYDQLGEWTFELTYNKNGILQITRIDEYGFRIETTSFVP